MTRTAATAGAANRSFIVKPPPIRPSRRCCLYTAFRSGLLSGELESPYTRHGRSGSDVECLREIGRQRQGWIQLAQQPAPLEGLHDKAGADLVVARGPAQRPAEQEEEGRADQVEGAEPMPDP